MSDEIRQLDPFETEADEAWERLTEEPDIRCVEAIRSDEHGGWQVGIAVAEFVQDGPLVSDLREGMTSALGAVGGVTSARQMDSEIWFVSGTPSGQALVEAAARVVDGLAGQLRAYLDSIG